MTSTAGFCRGQHPSVDHYVSRMHVLTGGEGAGEQAVPPMVLLSVLA
jgi:hypothetical protein